MIYYRYYIVVYYSINTIVERTGVHNQNGVLLKLSDTTMTQTQSIFICCTLETSSQLFTSLTTLNTIFYIFMGRVCNLKTA